MTNIQTRIKTTQLKAPKDKRFNAISALVDGLPHDLLTQYRHELTLLYSYFLPAPPKKSKTLHQWVSKARAKREDRRYYIADIYSDGDALVATDGVRVHIVDGLSLPKGYYDTNLKPLDVDWNFPDYARIIPEYKKPFQELPMDLQLLPDGKTTYAFIHDAKVDGRYLQDIVEDSPQDWLVQVQDESSPLYFKHKSQPKRAVLIHVKH